MTSEGVKASLVAAGAREVRRDAASLFHASNAAVPDRRLAPLRVAQHTLGAILEPSRADFVRSPPGLPLRLPLHRFQPGAPMGLLGDAVAELGTTQSQALSL
ncbi:hypothetical protein [Sorangium sp. So ce204]|uniref:hypothetical protein n=1 Tax=Sorangium sp. So ce204 TaxID=3133288 RepID=UPI003F5F3DE7